MEAKIVHRQINSVTICFNCFWFYQIKKWFIKKKIFLSVYHIFYPAFFYINFKNLLQNYYKNPILPSFLHRRQLFEKTVQKGRF